MAPVTRKNGSATESTEEPQLAAATGNDGAATEHTEEPQLAELLSQEAGLTSEIELQVLRNQLIDYSYTWADSQVSSQKLQVVLQSKIPDQYCLGVAKLLKKDSEKLVSVGLALWLRVAHQTRLGETDLIEVIQRLATKWIGSCRQYKTFLSRNPALNRFEMYG